MKKFSTIKIPGAIRPKKRKKTDPKEWKVGVVGLGLSSGTGFGNPVGGSGSGGEGAGTGGAMGESAEKHVYKYSCAMLNISDTNAPIFEYWAKKNISAKDINIDEEKGIDGYEDTPHVTIKFGLHDENPNALQQLVKGTKPIKIKFGKISKFDTNPVFDVVKVDVESEELKKLNKKISENMEHSDEFDEYKPHVTLAYVKKGTCENLVGNDFFDELEDVIDEIYFASRNGEEHYISIKE